MVVLKLRRQRDGNQLVEIWTLLQWLAFDCESSWQSVCDPNFWVRLRNVGLPDSECLQLNADCTSMSPLMGVTMLPLSLLLSLLSCTGLAIRATCLPWLWIGVIVGGAVLLLILFCICCNQSKHLIPRRMAFMSKSVVGGKTRGLGTSTPKGQEELLAPLVSVSSF